MNRRNTIRIVKRTIDEVHEAYVDERNRNNVRGKVSMREHQLFETVNLLTQAYTNLTNLTNLTNVVDVPIERLLIAHKKKKNEHNTKVRD